MERWQLAWRQIHRAFPEGEPKSPLVAVLGIAVFLALLWLFFRCVERRGESRRRPGELRTDLIYLLLAPLLDKTVLGLPAILILLWLVVLGLPRMDTWVGLQPLPLQMLEAVLLLDFIGYWVHRLNHTVPWLWQLHAVHHSSEQLDWVAGARSHPLEGAWNRIAGVAVLYVSGFSPAAFGPVVGFAGVYGILLHANVAWDYGALRWWIASPTYHRWHHSRQSEAMGKNYAAYFPWLDRLFGTAHFPRGVEPEEFGIAEGPLPVGLWAQLKWPFRNPEPSHTAIGTSGEDLPHCDGHELR